MDRVNVYNLNTENGKIKDIDVIHCDQESSPRHMQFSKDGSTLSALGRVLDAERPVTAFSMTGVSLGTFGDLMETARMLPAGAYVIKQGANTQTIVVK